MDETLAVVLVTLLVAPPVAPPAAAATQVGTPTTTLSIPGGLGSLAPADEATRANVEAGLGKLRLYFIENHGQVDSRVAYYVQGAANSIYLTRTGVVFALTSRVGGSEDSRGRLTPAALSPRSPGREPVEVRRHAIRLDFEGANPEVKLVGRERTEAVVSYFKGRPSEWKTALPTFAAVVYEELWPGIDLVYGSESGHPKYSFLVEPGADPGRIRLVYRGASGVRLSEGGRLAVETPVGGFTEERPFAYQEGRGEGRTEVEAAFAPEAEAGGTEYRFGFRVGAYDRTRPLVLDPVVLAYCGYIGGSGDDYGRAIAVDSSGNAYVTGFTPLTSASNFPVKVGPYLTHNNDATTDAFVAKINAAGTALVYCGYIGGDGSDLGNGIAVDSAGNAYVTGETNSTAGFPVVGAPGWAHATVNAGNFDAFVAKVKADGTGLVYSGFIGGSGFDYGKAIAVDSSGNAYVTGNESSPTSGGPPSGQFPVANGPDTSFNGSIDAFVAKVNAAGTALVYCGLIGGSQLDDGYGIAVDSSGSAYVVGTTTSTETDATPFPVTVGPDLTHNGTFTNDVFVAKISASSPYGLVYCGYVGGSGDDNGAGIAVDGSGNAYVTGYTNSTDIAAVGAPGWPHATVNAGAYDAFVAKVKATPTAPNGLVYFGYIGGTGPDEAYGIAIDLLGNAYVTGRTNSDEAAGGFPVTSAGPDNTFNGSTDAFVAKVDAAGTTLVYCGYIGGSATDYGYGIAVDGSGNAYVTGYAVSAENDPVPFPVTPVGGGFGPNHKGANTPDAYVAKVTATATALYRSVGPGNTTDLNTLTRTVAISGTTATFSGSMPDKVGVGDVLKYLGTVAFIHGRTSDQVYTVASASGGTPTAAGLGTTVSVYRAYTSLFNWEAQTENASIGVNFDNNSTDLVAANTVMNVACYGDADDTTRVTINGWTTDPSRYIRIYTPYLSTEVGATQRHNGAWDPTKYVIKTTGTPISIGNGGAGTNKVWIDGLQIWTTLIMGNGDGGIVTSQTLAADHRFSNNIVRGDSGAGNAFSFGIGFYDAAAGSVARIWNNIVYDSTRSGGMGTGIEAGGGTHAVTAYVYNNTVYNCFQGFYRDPNGTIIVKNNVYRSAGLVGADGYGGTFAAGSDYNSSDKSGDAPNATKGNTTPPWYSGLTADGLLFVSAVGRDLHLLSSAIFVDKGADLTSDPNLAFLRDIDGQIRPAGSWDLGADEYRSASAVTLADFAARGFESSVLVEWETASELDNLGFHLYRGMSPDGPWTRLDGSLIPGLGSSPEGRQYRWVDSSLVNGTTYFYRLEDVDRHGGIESHGPVSATPVAGVSEPSEGGSEGEGGGGGDEVEPPGSSTPTPERKAHLDPTQQSLRVLERDASGVTLELVTGGFFSEEQADGTSKLVVPGFFDRAEPGRPTVPTRRLWVDAVIGRGVRLVSVEPWETVSFPGLDVTLAGRPVAVAPGDGTYRASSIPLSRDEARRLARASGEGVFPSSSAFVHQTAFQGERKKAYVELAPLRVDERSGEVTLARRLIVRLAFAGRVAGERGRGSLGRSPSTPIVPATPRPLARLLTRSRGLHAVAFEQVPGLASPVSIADLRLSRLGRPVAFHLEPQRLTFGPGCLLVFLAEGTGSAYANEAVYELALGPGGLRLRGVPPSRKAPSTSPLTLLQQELTFEKNAVYLPALLEAKDLWLWDYGIAGGQGVDYPFTLDSPPLVPQTARLTLELQGGSDTQTDPDHHVLVFLNGSLVGETRFDGMLPHTLALDLPTSLLLDGDNTLRLENAGDTGSTASFVYLDRFSIELPRPLALVNGVLEGRAAHSGYARLDAGPGAVVLDLTAPTPRVLARAAADGRLSWDAEAGHRYLAVSRQAFLQPELRPAPPFTLRSTTNQAEWIAVSPQAFLPALEPLLALRHSQGLAARAVSYEAVVDEFGYGEAGPHALKNFLAFAFHHWTAPSPRYVLLLGEASYDPKGRLAATSRPDLIPSPLTRSRYLWTAADPLYAAVNGDDSLPDLAIGRINAATIEEAQTAVQKILDFETSGQSLAAKVTLVADNPDVGGNFEADQDDIASLLPSRAVEKLFLSRLGPDVTKAAVHNAFDSGLSLMSYVGHGSSGLWASEGILRSSDVASLSPQAAQPLVLTMTCSNGYFLSPFTNSLAERLVLAQAKGAIAAFSPSGLSMDEPAHVYHRALVSQLEYGHHDRLGDLLLAAQADYAASGAFPELLSLYHLFGDPAMRIQ